MGEFYSDELEMGIKLLYQQTDKSRYDEAVKLIEKAVENDEPDAYYVLARCYAWGDSGMADSRENDEKALTLSKRGVKLGSRMAVLGADRFSCLNDVKPFMDCTHEEAFEAVLKQAEDGNPLAMYAIGLVYFWGDIIELPTYDKGSEKDNALAGVEWFDKAAKRGFIPALRNAYNSRSAGSNGVPQDKNAAVCLAESVVGVCEIPLFLYANVGNDYDDLGMKDKMIEWYSKGVAAGEPICMYNMGYTYEHGDGVERNDETAYNYYMMAKKAGYTEKANKALAKFKKTIFGKIKKR